MLIVWSTRCRDCGKFSGRCPEADAAMDFMIAHWAAEGHEHGTFMVVQQDDAGRLRSEQFWGISHTRERQLAAVFRRRVGR